MHTSYSYFYLYIFVLVVMWWQTRVTVDTCPRASDDVTALARVSAYLRMCFACIHFLRPITLRVFVSILPRAHSTASV